jgi:hypothetical protein
MGRWGCKTRTDIGNRAGKGTAKSFVVEWTRRTRFTRKVAAAGPCADLRQPGWNIDFRMEALRVHPIQAAPATVPQFSYHPLPLCEIRGSFPMR